MTSYTSARSLFFGICTVLFVVFVETEAGLFLTGKVKVVFEDASNCPGYLNTPWLMTGTMRKYNRTHQAISGHVSIDQPLDDTLSINIEAQKWSDGGWKANALRLQKNNACTVLSENLGQTWTDVCQAAGLGPDVHCPIKEGTYSIEDMYVDASSSRLIFMTGRMKYIFSIWKKDTVLFCREIQVTISSI